jgi:hypothetical protein
MSVFSADTQRTSPILDLVARRRLHAVPRRAHFGWLGQPQGADAQWHDGRVKKMYYDLAGAAYAGIVASPRQLVTLDKILFGTDFPPGGYILEQAQAIRELKMLNEDELKLVERDNAMKRIPRLKKT